MLVLKLCSYTPTGDIYELHSVNMVRVHRRTPAHVELYLNSKPDVYLPSFTLVAQCVDRLGSWHEAFVMNADGKTIESIRTHDPDPNECERIRREVLGLIPPPSTEPTFSAILPTSG